MREILSKIKLNKSAPLVAILFIAALVRLIRFNSFGFNSDEAVYSGQSAAIIQNPEFREIFPIFRAHPLLFQFLLSLLFIFGVSDVIGRLVSVAFGLATVYTTYLLGKQLYGETSGLIGAIFLAIMPYHLIVTRQVLLDGPMTFFSTITFFLVAKYVQQHRRIYLLFAGISLGLTFLTKETGILFLASLYIFFSLSPVATKRFRDISLSIAIAVGLMAIYPLSIILAGGGTTSTARQYLIWQLFRQPNHSWDFYLRTIPFEMGILMLFLALIGFFTLRKERSWRETLLLSWIIVPILFFQYWPTKGYQYLLPISPVVAILAARTIGRWFSPQNGIQVKSIRFNYRQLAVIIVSISLLIPIFGLFTTGGTNIVLAGTGGIPGGRETGAWIEENLPDGSSIMTIGPSMANILQFYGNERAYGLSVSSNPLYRNPSYKPIINPDYQILMGEIQFAVWDAYSAQRSEFFSEKLLAYVQKYDGRVLHLESISLVTDSGEIVDEPVIILYRLYP